MNEASKSSGALRSETSEPQSVASQSNENGSADGVPERSLEDMLSHIRALEALSDDWPAEQANAANARALAIEELNAEAFKRLIRSLKTVPGMGQALREAATDEVVYAVLRSHGILKPSVHERVEAALDTIRPSLADHGGDVEVVLVEPPGVQVRFLGACDNCPASAPTFYSGVKKAIQDHVPEITEVKQVKGLGGASTAGTGDDETVYYASPFAQYTSDGWLHALDLAELADGQTKIIDIDGHSVLLSRFGDKVTCFENACAHMGMAMDGGEIADGIITCPYHEFKYALESGECLTAPEVQLQPHLVRVKGDKIDVRLVE
ncbi:MAG: hypothetical protein CMF68_12695 [Magnetovibrio sp.]|nr:hypothetical protein [Magnetovibrio sp.]